ncbi:MAG: 3-isopropylmalate dehydratase large subunit [Elusimicrobiota bacterium]
MSFARNIFKNRLNKKKLSAGEFVEAEVDVILSNDITTPLAIDAFESLGPAEIKQPEKAVIVADHFTPNKDIASAQQVKKVREFAKNHRIRFYDAGCGIEHVLLPEQGLVLPQDIIIGADSHTVTYGALGAFSTGVGSTDVAGAWATGKSWFKIPKAVKILLNGKPGPFVTGKDIILYLISQIGTDGAIYKGLEFCGDSMQHLSIDSRFTICNMVIECGAKYGIMEPDRGIIEYVEERAVRPYSPMPQGYSILNDDEFEEKMDIDVEIIKPQVAFPSSPANSKSVDSIKKIKIDQVVIGSCTNGRWDDYVKSAEIIKGKRVHDNLRLILIPSTARIYRKLIEKGIVKIFADAGAVISPPTCGPCLGGHMGILAEGEKALSTTNRNFVGRMGHKKSEVYLSNPQVAAATAVAGYITSPEEVINRKKYTVEK